MDRRSFLQALLLTLFSAGCGQMGQTNDNGEFSTPPTVKDEILKLISSRQLPDKRYIYEFAVKLSAIAGDRSSLFARYETLNDWLNVPMIDQGTGWATFSITTYDRLVKLLYGGNYSTGSFASITESSYYEVPPVDALYLGLENGLLLHHIDFAQGQFAGTAGDTKNVVGFNLQGDQLTIWFNLAQVAGSLANPYWFSDQTSWINQPIQLLDSRGWAETTINMPDGLIVRFTFGGDLSTDSSWAQIGASDYFNSGANLLVVGRVGNTIVAR